MSEFSEIHTHTHTNFGMCTCCPMRTYTHTLPVLPSLVLTPQYARSVCYEGGVNTEGQLVENKPDLSQPLLSPNGLERA